MAVDNGFTIIEPQEYDYMRVYPAHKGNYHVDRFTKIEKMGRRIIQTFDHQEYNDFRLRLMQDGKIRIPHQVLIKEIIIETQKRITRQDNKSHLPERQIKIKAMKTKVTNMKKAAAELETKGKKVYEIG
jgi:6-pyruvoyl-tetrahydropterin synthase